MTQTENRFDLESLRKNSLGRTSTSNTINGVSDISLNLKGSNEGANVYFNAEKR